MDVVVVVARTVGCAAQPTNLDRAVEGERAVGVGGDELVLDACPHVGGGGFVGFGEIAEADAFGQRIGEHAARGGFQIIAIGGVLDADSDASVRLLHHRRPVVRRLIHDLPPQPGLRILDLEYGGDSAIERSDENSALWMVLREPVENINEGYAVPAHGAAPCLGTESGLLIGPGHLLRLVPAMLEQAGFRVAHVAVHQQELLRDVVEVFGGLEGDGVLGAEGLGHVGAVEPHLVGVDLLVPVAAAGRARLHRELAVQEFGGLGVARVLGDPIEQQDGAAHLNVVQGVRIGLVSGNCSVGGYILVHRGLDVGKVVGVGGGMPLGGHAVEQEAEFVAVYALIVRNRPLL